MGTKNSAIQKPKLEKLEGKMAEKFKTYDRDGLRPLPLSCCFIPKTKQILSISNLNYLVNIQLGFITVTMIQTYENPLEEPTDLEYVFSTRANAAFTKLEVEFGNQRLVGLIKEKQQAQKEYLKGVQEGKTMVYSDKEDEFPDIMRFKLGNLAPQQKLIVHYQYIQPLEICVNEFWKLELEQVVHPRYKLEPDSIKAFKSLQQFINFDTFKYNFKQDITITFDFPSQITFCKSPTHNIIRIDKGVKDNAFEQIILDPQFEENFQPEKRFILFFSNEKIHEPIINLSQIERDELLMQQYCATITFIPKFNPLQLDDAYQAFLDQGDLNSNEFDYQQRGEYIFLLDRSGSMSGRRIEKAVQAIILFIKSLPEDSYFNVVSFGSEYQKIWPQSQKYNNQSAQEAIAKVEAMKADLGGTEILEPLERDIYKQKRNTGYPLNIFILTDGEVTPDPIIKLVREQAKPDTRVYTLGIGDGCSKFLVEKVAWVGNGKFHFIGDDEDLNSKVIDLLQDSITPYLENFNLIHNLKNPYCILPNPQSVICLRKNNAFTLQILFPKQEQDKINFQIQYYDPQIKQQCQFSTELLQSQAKISDQFHKLAAYKLIQSLEDAYLYDEKILDKILIAKESIGIDDIVGISVTHQVLSRATAFICEVAELNDQLKEKLKQKVMTKPVSSDSDDDERGVEKKAICKKSMVQKDKSANKFNTCKMAIRRQAPQSPNSPQQILFSCDVPKSLKRNSPQKVQYEEEDQEEQSMGCLFVKDEKSIGCLQEQFSDMVYDQESAFNSGFLQHSNSQLGEKEHIAEGDRDEEDYEDEGANDLDNNEDIKVPAFIKKRSENRYKREQEQLKLQKQQDQENKQKIELQQDLFQNKVQLMIQDFDTTESKVQKETQQKVIKKSVPTVEILKYVDMDGQFDLKVLEILQIQNIETPQGLTQQQWTNIIIIYYLDYKCQKDKTIWQLIIKKTIQNLAKNNIKYQIYKDQISDLIKDII